MILLTAVFTGLMVGLFRARHAGLTWQAPQLRHSWLVLVAFLPQFFAFYLPASREHMSDSLVAVCLVSSQVGLLIFCLFNRREPAILVLGAGLLLNFIVIVANGGFMPLSMEAAAQLIPGPVLQTIKFGSRIGPSSKDILLPFNLMAFPWLSDRFCPPTWLPYQFAFSLGDVFIGMGAYFVFATGSGSINVSQNQNTHRKVVQDANE